MNKRNEPDDFMENLEITFDAPKYRTLSSGFYRARLIDIRQEKGLYGMNLVPVFELEEALGKGLKQEEKEECRGCATKDLISLNSRAVNTKIWRFVKALSGIDHKENEKVKLRKLIGKECILDVQRIAHVNKIDYFLGSPDDLRSDEEDFDGEISV